MESLLHLFLQSISSVIILGFIFQLSFISESNMYLQIIGKIHSVTPFAFFLLFNKLFIIFSLVLLTFLFTYHHFLKRPSYLQNISSLIFLALGIALMGFTKLTLGELNAFTLGFLKNEKSLVGSDFATDFNVIRIRDYSTMYGSPNGYFFYLVLLVNLLAVRVFSKGPGKDKETDTALPSRAEFNISMKTLNRPKRRRSSIDAQDLQEEDKASRKNLEIDSEREVANLESTRRFQLFEKEYSMQSPDSLSKADSSTSNIKSCQSNYFLEKFEHLGRASAITKILLKFKNNPLAIEKKKPQLFFSFLITYTQFKKLSTIVIIYVAFSLYLSGNAFMTDLLFGFLLAKVYSRFYFKTLER